MNMPDVDASQPWESPDVAPLDGVSKIAVLQPGAVGDFVFALPALHAMKQAYPGAELVYLGKPWHQDFLRGRPGPVDRVLVLPPVPGVGQPGDAKPDLDAIDAFVARVQNEKFDLGLQMFGGGRYSNPFLIRLGARINIGARAADAAPLDRWLAYVERGSRRLALLEVAALAGARAAFPAQELAVTDADRREADSVLQAGTGGDSPPAAALSLVRRGAPPAPQADGRAHAALPSAARVQPTAAGCADRPPAAQATALRKRPPLVVLQPGATDSRRCWGVERFAAVGDVLAASGARVAINGSAQEAGRVGRLRACMRHPSVDLSGRLGLGGLCGLLERAALVVSNDTGPLHLALAVGTPCVGIFWHTNFADGMPLRPSLLRAAVSGRQHCPVCDADNRVARCRHAESFVNDVAVDEVAMLAMSLLHPMP